MFVPTVLGYKLLHCLLSLISESNWSYPKITKFALFFLLKFQYPAALMNLGAILHLNGKLQEAEANYLRALQLKPDDAITQSNLRKLWNIMEKQGLRTTSPWAQETPPTRHLHTRPGKRTAYTLLICSSHPGKMEETQGECLLTEAVTVPHSSPNDSWASHTPQASNFPQNHCSQFGRRYVVFGLLSTFFKIKAFLSFITKALEVRPGTSFNIWDELYLN